MRTQLWVGALIVVFGGGLVACGDDDGGNNDSTCGDDTATGQETCDGPDLRDHDCTSIGLGYTGGSLGCNSYCDGWDVTGCTDTSGCGDNQVNNDELCDGADLDGQDCTSIGMGFTGGTLVCAESCDGWDVTGCTTEPTCGNDAIDGGELCDGADLDGQDCAGIGMGFSGGTLACAPSCADWDTSGCLSDPACGNDVIEGDEKCDGADLKGYTCATVHSSFAGGTLACNATCSGWDTSGCTLATCGDGIINGNEACDGANLGGQTCASLSPLFSGGTLACNAGCQYWDISGCIPTVPVCGNGVQEGHEACDGGDLAGQLCTDFFYDSGTLACGTHCQLDLSGCINTTIPGWTCDPNWYDEVAVGAPCDCGCGIVDPDCLDSTSASCTYCDELGSCNGPADCSSAASIIDPNINAVCTTPTCGNNLAEGTEMCDGPDLRATGCQDLNQGFTGGTLACTASCFFDTSNCTMGVCGNNVRDGYEWCDGPDLASETCQTLGYVGGTLGCDGTCNYDVSNCTGATCGDGTAEGGELCDGAELNGWDCASLPWGYTGGTLACYLNCTFDTSQCTPSVCGDNVLSNDEDCDGSDMGNFSTVCADFGWDSGTVGCTASCDIDFSACVGSAPAGWNCYPGYYGDGPCDCGCGVVDVDCANSTVASCQFCNDPGACTDPWVGCPANIDPADNSQCL